MVKVWRTSVHPGARRGVTVQSHRVAIKREEEAGKNEEGKTRGNIFSGQQATSMHYYQGGIVPVVIRRYAAPSEPAGIIGHSCAGALFD